MSLHQLAQQIQSHGRGNDSQLVHMTPTEVRAMRNLAQRHGGDLSINPRTGLPEAGFLENLLPTLVGAGVGIATGNPFIGAAAGGALGMAANKGSIQSGLMAGLGAYGMGSLGAGLMEAGAGAGAGLTNAQAAAAANPALGLRELTQAAQSNIDPSLLEGMSAQQVAQANVLPQNASNFDKLLKGASNTTFNADFFKKNLMPLGAAAAPLLMSGSGGNLFGGNPQEQSAGVGYIRPYTFRQTRNPGYTGAGTPFFTQSMTPGTPVAASDFGATGMANGGLASLPAANPQPGVVVYDPVSGRYIQQAASTVPMTPNAAPVTEPVGGLAPVQYNPLTGQYVTPPPAVTPMPNATVQEPIDYAYGLGGGETGSVADDGTTSGNESGGAEGAGGNNDGGPGAGSDAGGDLADGGRVKYAMGGDIGMRYQSSDDMGMGDRIGAHATVNMGPQYPMQSMYQGYAGGGHLGGYSDGGRLLRGPGDGVSDDIPAQIGARQPARLADGEFVVPARIVSELGNGSTDAGAKRLYAMMDRVQNNRRKSVGKDKVAVDSKAYRHLPA